MSLQTISLIAWTTFIITGVTTVRPSPCPIWLSGWARTCTPTPSTPPSDPSAPPSFLAPGTSRCIILFTLILWNRYRSGPSGGRQCCGSMTFWRGSGKFFRLFLFEGTFTSFFFDKKSKRSHKTVGIKFFSLLFLLDDRRIRIQEAQKHMDRIRIRNTGGRVFYSGHPSPPPPQRIPGCRTALVGMTGLGLPDPPQVGKETVGKTLCLYCMLFTEYVWRWKAVLWILARSLWHVVNIWKWKYFTLLMN